MPVISAFLLLCTIVLCIIIHLCPALLLVPHALVWLRPLLCTILTIHLIYSLYHNPAIMYLLCNEPDILALCLFHLFLSANASYTPAVQLYVYLV